MARSRTKTLLALDEYSRIMAIPGWHFNQVTNPCFTYDHVCDDILLQSGYSGDPNRILGRDEIAQAIATAESMIARFLRYWPAPRYICHDEKVWPVPKRGVQIVAPSVRTSWKNLIEFGTEAYTLLGEDELVVYTDASGDGCLDTGTVTFVNALEDVLNQCELVVVPHGYNPVQSWEIRPLTIGGFSTGTVVFVGRRWQFVIPTEWDTNVEIDSTDDTKFLTGGIYGDGVDIYRHYTNPAFQSQIVWRPSALSICGNGGAVLCQEVCQYACVVIHNSRTGLVSVAPAYYDAGLTQWTSMSWTRGEVPAALRFWYLAGYRDDVCELCDWMGPSIKEAIVSLANTRLPEPPCGCVPVRERFERDREEMSVDSMDVELAQSAFGSTMRGAVFAYNIFSNLPPIGQGG